MLNVLPTVADVADAYVRLRDWVFDTPLLESPELNELAGARLLLKAESLQHGGSFKIRGALNRALQLKSEERDAGVVAFSSGNHAQAVALAASWLGMHATILMPSDAPQAKLAGTRRWGAEVILYDHERDDRERLAADLVAARRATLVPPFDHPHVIAGQGTAGLELARTARARDIDLDALYVPCSGGGLVAGCALAVKSIFPSCAVYAVEPETCADTLASLESGERRAVATQGPTICDGLRARLPGAITFAINRRELAGVVTVSDDAVRRAMALAVRYLRVVLEPSGAAALAAVLERPPRERRAVGIILSGGNVDARVLSNALATGEAETVAGTVAAGTSGTERSRNSP